MEADVFVQAIRATKNLAGAFLGRNIVDYQFYSFLAR
jgi:hypothetical protein